MKYITLFIATFFIYGCKDHPVAVVKEAYPRIVHNSCRTQWAVQTGYGPCRLMDTGGDVDLFEKNQPLYWGESKTIGGISFSESLGNEFSFQDSTTALIAFSDYQRAHCSPEYQYQ